MSTIGPPLPDPLPHPVPADAPAEPGGPAGGAPAPQLDRPRMTTLQLLRSNPVTVAASVVLVLVVAVAVLGRWIAPYGANEIDVVNALQPPSGAHWFGTDALGRDVFSRVLRAAGVSLQVALVSVAFAFVVGVTIGIVSGYVRGLLDTVLMRLVDVMFAFPVLLLALAIVAIMGPGILTTMLAIGVVYTPIFARVARASALSVSVEPYVQVSRTMGTPWWYIMGRHVLPNVSGPLIVQTSLSLAFAILSEAALSFLGLGVQPPAPSWGRMLAEAQGFLGQAWWMGVFPGLAIFLTALAFNLFGDGRRYVLDPKQRTIIEARRKR
ncbi:ABC transporter permease [Salana multivorans]